MSDEFGFTNLFLVKRYNVFKGMSKYSFFVGLGEIVVTIDRSLKRKGRLARSRNVLKREERIAQMEVEDKWVEGRSPLGIPKTRVIKITLGKKKKVKAEPAEGEKDKKPAKKGK